jgi:hypothetical protein
VQVSFEGLRVSTPDEAPRLWPFAELTLVRGQSRDEPVQLEWSALPVQVVIVRDPAFRSELFEAIPRGTRLRGAGGVRVAAPALLVVLALLVLAAVAAWRFGVPALAGALADRVPRDWEREFGEQVVTDFAPPARRVQDSVVAGPVRRLYDRLRASGRRASSPRPSWWRDTTWRTRAAPGGAVVVTTGLLRALRSPDELAAVLAHGAGPARRHALREPAAAGPHFKSCWGSWRGMRPRSRVGFRRRAR